MANSEQYASYSSLRNRRGDIVTGGATGIGEAMVEAVAMQHARVAFIDIQDDAAAKLVERLGTAGGVEPVYYHCDLTNIAEIGCTVASILQAFWDSRYSGEQCRQRYPP